MRYALVELGHVLIASTLFAYVLGAAYIVDVFDKIIPCLFCN